MAAHKWSAARVVKVWLDIVLALCAAGLGLLILWLLLMSSHAVRHGGTDAAVVVAIGSHSLVPRMPLELAAAPPGGDSDFLRATLVHGYGELRTVTTDWGLHLVSMLFFVVGGLVVLYAIWILREILKSVLAGEPFAPANSRRLRRIGFIVLALAVVVPGAEYLIGQAFLRRLTVEGLSLSPAFRLSKDVILTGLLFLVLSVIFRHGTELEEERALTV
jgi:hypothetical protein